MCSLLLCVKLIMLFSKTGGKISFQVCFKSDKVTGISTTAQWYKKGNCEIRKLFNFFSRCPSSSLLGFGRGKPVWLPPAIFGVP